MTCRLGIQRVFARRATLMEFGKFLYTVIRLYYISTLDCSQNLNCESGR